MPRKRPLRCPDCRRPFAGYRGQKYGRCPACKALGLLLVKLHRQDARPDPDAAREAIMRGRVATLPRPGDRR